MEAGVVVVVVVVKVVVVAVVVVVVVVVMVVVVWAGVFITLPFVISRKILHQDVQGCESF